MNKSILRRAHAIVASSKQVYGSLHQRFKGDLLRPGESGYDDARSIWNGLVDRTPGLIARCANVTDVQNALRAGSETGILTAVRWGGHSLAGFSTCDGGMVIDLSRMCDVTVDPDTRAARIAGGCLLGSIDAATQKAGLVFPSGGVVSHTGAAGLILGGGTGWLTSNFRCARRVCGLSRSRCGGLRYRHERAAPGGTVEGVFTPHKLPLR